MWSEEFVEWSLCRARRAGLLSLQHSSSFRPPREFFHPVFYGMPVYCILYQCVLFTIFFMQESPFTVLHSHVTCHFHSKWDPKWTFIHSYSVTNLSWLVLQETQSLSQEHWAWDRNTTWMWCQFIAGHHAHRVTNSFTSRGNLASPVHLLACLEGQRTCLITGRTWNSTLSVWFKKYFQRATQTVTIGGKTHLLISPDR